MNSLSKSILTLALGAMTAAAGAQELNESMTVQGAYDPVIRHHERISFLPDRITLPLPEASLPPALQGAPVSVESRLTPQDAPAVGTRLPASYRGYLDLYAGSYLNTSLSAGYRAIATPTTTLGLWLQHTSSSLYRPNDESPYRRRFDETLGGRLSHIFAPGTLSMAATYHLGYFNYYRAISHDTKRQSLIPGSQTLNDLLVSAAWHGNPAVEGLSYEAGASYRMFGFRRIYERGPEAMGIFAARRPARENDIKLNGAITYSPNGASAFSLGLQGRWLPYSNSELHTPSFYTITPAYTLTTPVVSMRLGARLDLNHSVQGAEKFSGFHAAPDVSVHLCASRFTATISATGGVSPVTIASLHELDYYSIPTLTATTPMFTPVNARLRLGFGNLFGFTAGISVSYAATRNTPLAGTYPLYLFNLPGTPSYRLATLNYLDVHGFSAGADMHFALSRLFTFDGTLTYSPQHGSRGSFNGIDRPRWVLATQATVRPVEPLTITLGYDYRGVRNLYYRSSEAGALCALRLPDLYDLHAEAAYTIAGRYTLGIVARNILSSNPWLTPDMPIEGFTLLGRFSVVF